MRLRGVLQTCGEDMAEANRRRSSELDAAKSAFAAKENAYVAQLNSNEARKVRLRGKLETCSARAREEIAEVNRRCASELDAVKSALAAKKDAYVAQLGRNDRESSAAARENERLRGELQTCSARAREEIAEVNRRCSSELDAAESSLAAKNAYVAQLGRDLAARNTDLECSTAEIARLRGELQTCSARARYEMNSNVEIQRLNGELQASSARARENIAEVNRRCSSELDAAESSLAAKNTYVAQLRGELSAKDACVAQRQLAQRQLAQRQLAQLGRNLAARDADLKCYKAAMGFCVLENPFSILDPRSLSSESAIHAAVTDAGNQDLWAQLRAVASTVGAVAIKQEHLEGPAAAANEEEQGDDIDEYL
ncbi:hypothetical protein TeGR_g1373 [Tetraparma gracilis]|uniref:Uncharacterized protein n=1 Tax=Tetraparma gracilis TaxID=2962635 RepID=A0ABQ6MZR5_9STRA|nr:hypothetical protein TeGR_g1373 [Tetraparma gracilis]